MQYFAAEWRGDYLAMLYWHNQLYKIAMGIPRVSYNKRRS